MTAAELDLLRASAVNHGGDARELEIVVTGCAHSCCGRGWRRRDGYEQTYHGYVDNLTIDEPGAFMLYSKGIGTLSYVLAVRFSEVQSVEPRT